MKGARWWTLDEMRSTHEVLAPRKLAELLAPILADEIPMEPIELQGW